MKRKNRFRSFRKGLKKESSLIKLSGGRINIMIDFQRMDIDVSFLKADKQFNKNHLQNLVLGRKTILKIKTFFKNT